MDGARILIVDDYEAHLYALSRRLEQLGFVVDTAANGKDALTMARHGNYDAVLLDINLPDMNGLDICSTLRSDPDMRSVAIVFHTATSANERSQLEAQARGADGFLTYPIEISHLHSVLLGSITRRKAKGASAGV